MKRHKALFLLCICIALFLITVNAHAYQLDISVDQPYMGDVTSSVGNQLRLHLQRRFDRLRLALCDRRSGIWFSELGRETVQGPSASLLY